jgi:hypothetical protein
VSTTGIAGLTSGGGIGWLQRKHGLACDNLLSADVVTADGRFLAASATEHPDLFWGLRGGGGNFGVVTSFEYRLHPLGKLLAGPVLHSFSAAKDAFRFFGDFMQAAPDEVSGAFALNTLADGDRAAVLLMVYAGPPEEGEKVTAPVREFGSPLEDSIRPMGYCDLQQVFDADFPFGVKNYWKSSNVAALSDDAIDTMLDSWSPHPRRGRWSSSNGLGRRSPACPTTPRRSATATLNTTWSSRRSGTTTAKSRRTWSGRARSGKRRSHIRPTLSTATT